MTEHKKAIILLGHGSRVRNAGGDMEKIAGLLKGKYGFPLVEYCFMSRLGPHFPETLEKVVAAGADSVMVIPYFLHTGLHIRLDIPEMMQAEAEKYPSVKIQLGKNLGYDESLAELVVKRIGESESEADIREVALPERDAFPVPPGQGEFVEMEPEEARKYMMGRGHSHGHCHHDCGEHK